MCACACVRRERNRNNERDGERYRKTETDGEKQRQRKRQRDGQGHRVRGKKRNRDLERKTPIEQQREDVSEKIQDRNREKQKRYPPSEEMSTRTGGTCREQRRPWERQSRGPPEAVTDSVPRLKDTDSDAEEAVSSPAGSGETSRARAQRKEAQDRFKLPNPGGGGQGRQQAGGGPRASHCDLFPGLKAGHSRSSRPQATCGEAPARSLAPDSKREPLSDSKLGPKGGAAVGRGPGSSLLPSESRVSPLPRCSSALRG